MTVHPKLSGRFQTSFPQLKTASGALTQYTHIKLDTIYSVCFCQNRTFYFSLLSKAYWSGSFGTFHLTSLLVGNYIHSRFFNSWNVPTTYPLHSKQFRNILDILGFWKITLAAGVKRFVSSIGFTTRFFCLLWFGSLNTCNVPPTVWRHSPGWLNSHSCMQATAFVTGAPTLQDTTSHGQTKRDHLTFWPLLVSFKFLQNL